MSSGLTEGAVFAGRYRVVRCIATGGMGAVYEVVHLETARRRALKVMHPHILQSRDLRERFQREAKVAAAVESDFIVDVFDAGYDEATRMPFLVMELLRGEELGVRLHRLGRLSPSEVVAYLHQTAVALDKTHRAGIVHRDLKPENLFLSERDDGPPRVKVLDFGVAKVLAEGAAATGTTQTIGTPLYMAPEQLDPSVRLTGAADRYALAMVTYALLVGAPYWSEESRAGNVLALAMVAVRGPREPASARAARAGVALPPAFDAWFARSTALAPGNRPASAVEMVVTLAAALGVPAAIMTISTGGLTSSATALDAVQLPAARSRNLMLMVASGMAALSLVGVAVLLTLGRTTPGTAKETSAPVVATAPIPAAAPAPEVTAVASASASAVDIDAPAAGASATASAAGPSRATPPPGKPGGAAPRAGGAAPKPSGNPARGRWGRD